MIKTKTIETIEKYDKDGKLVEKIVRETTGKENDIKIKIDYSEALRAVARNNTGYCGFFF